MVNQGRAFGAGVRQVLVVAGVIAVLAIVLPSIARSKQSRPPLVVGAGAYDSVEAALANAIDGDVVLLRSGAYSGDVLLWKQVTLAAFGDGEVWIDGGCLAETGVRVTAAGARLHGVGIKNTVGAGIEVRADGVVIENARVEQWNCRRAPEQLRAGVACWYCSGLTVSDSRFSNQRSFGNGIWLKSTDRRPSRGGHTIARNQIEGGFDGIGSESEADEHGGFHSDSRIEDNIINGCWDDGIQVEGRNENVEVRGNTISGCSAGIAFSPNLVGPLRVERNTIRDLEQGFHDQQACFKAGRGGNGMTYLTANTCRTAGDGLKQSNPGLGPIVATENCIDVTRYVIDFSGQPPQGTILRNNVMESSDTNRFIKWGGVLYSKESSKEAIGAISQTDREPSCA